MTDAARALMVVGLATTGAGLLPLEWGLVTLGGAGVMLAVALREGARRRTTALIVALLALGATGAGIILVGAL